MLAPPDAPPQNQLAGMSIVQYQEVAYTLVWTEPSLTKVLLSLFKTAGEGFAEGGELELLSLRPAGIRIDSLTRR